MATDDISRSDRGEAVNELASKVRTGDRRALARAITLVESTRADHRAEAQALLAGLLPQTGRAVRLGISGAPGVGKSTFIERFGLYLVEQGQRPAVLAVDPSSVLSGGSILGDKTRMADLARAPAAFIRPSPTGRTGGGVARRTREAMLVCEAAGFDVVVVETVGVGQSETAVAEMVDMFVLLLAPGAGDELQGIKRGIVELADLIVVNKDDGELMDDARRVAADYSATLGLLRPVSPRWSPRVLQVSALEGKGIDAVWRVVADFRAALGAAEIEHRRTEQARAWMWREVGESLMDELRRDQGVAALVPDLEARLAAGEITPSAAAEALLGAFHGRGSPP
jgi:LAO/AO transport system kinase